MEFIEHSYRHRMDACRPDGRGQRRRAARQLGAGLLDVAPLDQANILGMHRLQDVGQVGRAQAPCRVERGAPGIHARRSLLLVSSAPATLHPRSGERPTPHAAATRDSVMLSLRISVPGSPWRAAALAVTCALASLGPGCASSPPLQRAAGEAADHLAESAALSLPVVAEDAAAAADALTSGTGATAAPLIVPVIVAVEGQIKSTVSEHLHRARFVPVAYGPEQSQLLKAVSEQLRDVYSQESAVPGTVLFDMNQIGRLAKSDVLVISDVRALEGDEYEVVLIAWQLSTGFMLATGNGDSIGWIDTSLLVLQWAVTPFVALFDIGRCSADYAFDSDDEDSTILGTLYDSLVFVIYLPVAIFRSDYEYTKDWVSNDDAAPATNAQ